MPTPREAYQIGLFQMLLPMRLLSGENVLQTKYRQYGRAATLYQILYYSSRLIAALSGGLLPFVIGSAPFAATCLSVTVVVCLALDAVFDPKSKWTLYSRATDLIAIAELKQRGEYDKYREQLEVIFITEQKALVGLMELQDVLDKVQKSPSAGSPSVPSTAQLSHLLEKVQSSDTGSQPAVISPKTTSP